MSTATQTRRNLTKNNSKKLTAEKMLTVKKLILIADPEQTYTVLGSVPDANEYWLQHSRTGVSSCFKLNYLARHFTTPDILGSKK